MTFTGFTIAMFVLGAAGTAYSAYQQHKMADEAEDIAKRNMKIEEERTERQIEMAERAQEAKLGEAKARMAASGLEEEGTPGFYITELERLGDEEITWIEREGEWKRQQLKLEGKQAASQLKAGSIQSLVGLFTGGAQFLQNYQQRPKSKPISSSPWSYGYDDYSTYRTT